MIQDQYSNATYMGHQSVKNLRGYILVAPNGDIVSRVHPYRDWKLASIQRQHVANLVKVRVTSKFPSWPFCTHYRENGSKYLAYGAKTTFIICKNTIRL